GLVPHEEVRHIDPSTTRSTATCSAWHHVDCRITQGLPRQKNAQQGKGVASSSHGSKRSGRASEEQDEDVSLPQQPLRCFRHTYATRRNGQSREMHDASSGLAHGESWCTGVCLVARIPIVVLLGTEAAKPN
ncbi:hypothetical protein HAX54_002084, partial [Datura stramonium]|nr:hypothetical protein [Datura stramonium]